MQNETKNCQNCKKDFIIDADDFSFYEKMQVPVPNVCPDCRFKMRAMWRNEMTLYSGQKCEMCGGSIITVYNQKSLYKKYCFDCYSSDKWNPRDFVKEYVKSELFFTQLNKLLLDVPKSATFISTADGPNINSEYSNMAGGLKNCYMVFNSGPFEESLYTRGIRDSKEVVDCYYGINLELVYEGVNCSKSSKIIYGDSISGCVDCSFISNCSGCTSCFGCVNLRNASHFIFNKQVSKEEYKEFTDNILGSYEKMEKFKKEFNDFKIKFPIRENHNLKSVDSIGDYLLECKNVINSFEVVKSENCKFLFSAKHTKDSMGVIGFGFNSENLLEDVAIGYSSNIIGSCTMVNSRNIFYSFALKNCHDCIGCDSLKNAEYCILNKQYSKEEYEELKNHIVNELTDLGIHGLMMPVEIAPFAYNESIAQDNFPLTKEEAIASGFRWEDDIQMTKGKETIQGDEIEDNIKNVNDSITNDILKCISCERNYKITEQELLFYRKMNLPIPRQCFFCRHQDRIKRRGPYKFWDRKCDHCGKDIKTNYSPDRKEIIYCEKCYQQEVI